MPRLFVAVPPDGEVHDALTHLRVLDEPGVRRVAPANWHVTLRFIGDVATTEIDPLIEALDTAPLERTVFELGPAVVRLGSRQLVVPVAGADALAASVRAATVGVGVTDERPFFGHLTVARCRDGAPSLLDGAPITARQDARAVELVESELLSTGARYTLLHRWSLE